jgi:hypothetical protein
MKNFQVVDNEKVPTKFDNITLIIITITIIIIIIVTSIINVPTSALKFWRHKFASLNYK